MNIPGTDDTHLGDRWLNPRIGAFTQPDPQTQLDNPANANAYPYAADNPTNCTEPTGMFSLYGLTVSILNGAFKGVIAGCIVGAVTGEGVGCIPGIVPGSIIGGLTGGAFYIYDSFAPEGGA